MIESIVVGARPHLAVAPDGVHVAIADAKQLAVVALDAGTVVAAGGLEASDELAFAWLADDQLITLARDGRARVVTIERDRGRFELIAEIVLPDMVLRGAAGGCALATRAGESVVLALTSGRLVAHPFPAKAAPVVVGPSGHGRLVTAHTAGDAIEEWDLAERRPRRRLRLPPNSAVAMLGGSEHVVWWVAPDRARVEIIPLVTRNQPRQQVIGEPIAQVAGWPRGDALVCVGARTHHVVLVDLDGKQTAHTLELGDRIAHPDAVALGATAAVIAQTGRPLVIAPVALAPADPPRTRSSPSSAPPHTPLGVPLAFEHPRAAGSWRDQLAAWIRAPIGTPAPDAPRLRELAARLDLPDALVELLALAYGAHLCGEPGVPPINAARVSNWSEALGTGLAAARGTVELVASRLGLTASVRRWLDEAPPATGVLVGTLGAADELPTVGPCVVVAVESPAALATRLAAELATAILVVTPGAASATVALEARLWGAIPLHTRELPGDYVLVVPDEDAAVRSNLPRYRATDR